MASDAERLSLAEFETLIETFGANPARWPAGRRGDAEARLRADAQARQLLAEMRALDRLLDRAPAIDPSRVQPLAHRIVAAAMLPQSAERLPATGSVVSSPINGGARVIPLPVRSRQVGTVAKAPQPARIEPDPASSGGVWRAGMALAASLLLGVFIGLSDLASTTALDVAQLGQAATSETELILSALQSDGFGFGALDEDQI